MSELDQTTSFMTTGSGFPIPVLRPEFGKTLSGAVTTTPGARIQVHNNSFRRVVRIWSIGCPLMYKFGDNTVTAATAADGCVGQDNVVETYMDSDKNYISIGARSGSGSYVIEVLA